MKRILIPIFIVLSMTLAPAVQKDAPDGLSPDKHYKILILSDAENSSVFSVGIQRADSNKLIFDGLCAGYGYYRSAEDPDYFKGLWSPSSQFVAIYTRGTKRTGETTLYFINENKVQEIKVPAMGELIQTRLGKSEVKSWLVRPESWTSDRELVLSVEGTQSNQGLFRFLVTLQLSKGKAGSYVAAIACVKEDRAAQ